MILQPFRTDHNGVPVLDRTEIDIIAERFVSDFNPAALETPMEIDIDSFALNYLGLKQDFQYLSHNGTYLGMMVFNDTDRVPIFVPETNTAEYISAKARTVIIETRLLGEGQEHRYRFTMGHEAGHDIFHKSYFTYIPGQLSFLEGGCEPMIQCRETFTAGRKKNVLMWDDKDWMEWQANNFSAALLMPKSMVYRLIRPLHGSDRRRTDAIYADEVAKTFNVSYQSAVYRLICLGIIKEDALIESSGADFI